MALLAKQGWRILQNPDSIFARVLKQKYFSTCDLLSAPEKTNASFVWKSIYSSLGILRRGTTFDISNNIYSCNMTREENFTVKAAYAVIEQDNLISNCVAGPSSISALSKFWKTLWCMVMPRKVKIFLWRAANNGLPVGEVMF